MSETITMGGILGTNIHLPCESYLPVITQTFKIGNVIFGTNFFVISY